MLGLEIFLIPFLIILSAILYYIFLKTHRIKEKKECKNKLELKSNEIEQAHKELMTLWNRTRYLEQRTIKQWLAKWSYLESLINDCVKHKISNLKLNQEITLSVNLECLNDKNCNIPVVEENFLKGFLKFKPQLGRECAEGRLKIALNFLRRKELQIYRSKGRPKRVVDKRKIRITKTKHNKTK